MPPPPALAGRDRLVDADGMDDSEARQRFAGARVGRLATVGKDGSPHVVPVVFALVGDVIYTAVDHKPKTTTRLRRLANIEATGQASVLVDNYDENWSELWWVRADGHGAVRSPGSAESRRGVSALVDKYPQYANRRPTGPIIAVEVTRWRSWSAS